MRKPIATMTFAEWIADQIKALAPYAKTIKPIGVYFAAIGYEDVNVDFNRKIAGYSNWHFTDSSLKQFYDADSCTFDTDYGIVLEFDSWDKVVEDKDGKIYPKKSGCAKIKKPIVFLTLEEWASDMARATSNATDVKPIGASFVSEGIVSVTFNKKVQGSTIHKYADIGIAGLYGAVACIFNSKYGVTLVFDSYDKVVDKDGFWKPKKDRIK